MIFELIKEAVQADDRREPACGILGLTGRTLQRWQQQDGREDRRCGPRATPSNKFCPQEREYLLKVVNSPEFRDLLLKQIVTQLADREEYMGSESTMYRVMRPEGQLGHRQNSRSPTARKRGYPSIDRTQTWADRFVAWHNPMHLHRAIHFATSDDHHYGRDTEILAKRCRVYENARCKNTDAGRGPTETENLSRPSISALKRRRTAVKQKFSIEPTFTLMCKFIRQLS